MEKKELSSKFDEELREKNICSINEIVKDMEDKEYFWEGSFPYIRVFSYDLPEGCLAQLLLVEYPVTDKSGLFVNLCEAEFLEDDPPLEVGTDNLDSDDISYILEELLCD